MRKRWYGGSALRKRWYGGVEIEAAGRESWFFWGKKLADSFDSGRFWSAATF
ncbi:MAG: hypothetical protein GY820_31170 [Gammaproteobacteria bacterium]|nr:hypothetical protein [Gammaproteobacteria bacterium]